MFGVKRDAVADRDNRIQHRTLAIRERGGADHRLRRSDGITAPDKLRAVGLVRYLANTCAVYRHQVKHPRCLFGE